MKNMKKISALLLCLVFVISMLTGCGEQATETPTAAPTQSETESVPETTAESTEEKGAFGDLMNPTAYKEGHYYLDDLEAAGCLKRFGRTQFEEHSLTCDWSATGIGFRIKSEGSTMTVSYQTSYDTYFAVFIDGKKVSHESLAKGKGNIRFKVESGDHEIELRKENEINIEQQSYCYLTELQLKNGAFYARPEDKKYFIEIIGDSIACGDGCLGVFNPDKPLWNINDHSATSSFAAVCARQFDADYSLVSRGGIGVIKSRDAVGLPMPKIYPYISPYRDTVHEYDFARKPDLIIYELGANDGEYSAEDYYAATVAFLDEVYARYGKDVPVLWTGRAQGFYDKMKQYKEDHPEIRFYQMHFDYGSSGAGGSSTSVSGHPNVAEQEEYGEILALFIEKEGILK